VRLAFYGRVSTEDQQDPEASRGWQLSRARQLVGPVGGEIAAEFFDIGTSRSLPWKRRPQASRLLTLLADHERGFVGVVIGEPQRAFYGNQFGLTFPVFTHYGVQLWVPEVGGPIDPGSEAHDLVMTLFGGMSKGERTRIQVRTRAAMSDLAARTDRFLGGRPPYGYQLIDAGPHPNPGRAAAGQRAHRLEPDPLTGPVVDRIFRLYADGLGLRAIAQLLTDGDIPSPSAYDPVRNPHRDGRGWAHSAVRAILKNEVYTGTRVWAKQQKFEQLIDPNDVAAGNQVRMRWRNEDEWIRAEAATHQALVTADLFDLVRARMASPMPSEAKPRATPHVYLLRGVLFCAHCGRRMQGAWRKNRAEDSSGRTLYRCAVRNTRAVPAELENHPKSLYVREDAILGPLDEWIAGLVTPQALADAHDLGDTGAQAGAIRSRLNEVDRKIASLVGALESGVSVPEIAEQINRRSMERAGLEAQLRQAQGADKVTTQEMRKALEDLGGIATLLPSADPTLRSKLYASLGVRLEYDHQLKRVRATAETACVPGRVRRGT
jgi:site-specific DNA recombinase